MPRLKVNWDDRIFKNKVNRAVRSAQNRRDILGMVSEQVRTDLEKHFDREVDSSGLPWTPLSSVTVALRRNKGRESTRILQDTGTGSRMNISPSKDRVGSGAEYMELHNTGGSSTFNGRPVQIPQREWAYVSDDGKQRVKAAIKYYMERNL